MKIKAGARRDNFHPSLDIAVSVMEKVWPVWYPDDADGALISSGSEGHPGDGIHSFTSKHYPANNPSGKGEAADFRLNDVRNALAHHLAGTVETVLFRVHGISVKILLEGLLTTNAHLHLELR